MPIPQKSSMVPSTDKSAVGMSAPVEDGDAVAMEAVALLRSSTSQSHFSDDYDDADEGNGDNDNTGSGAVRSFDNSGTFVIDSPSVVRKMSGKSDPKGVRRQSPSHFSNAISHPPQLAWKLSCLRQPNCTQTHQSTCHHIRCSTCSEAACSDGQCVSFSKLCDGHLNCRTGDDEAECTAKSFRLSNGTDTSGYVEVLFRSNWEPVCGDSIKLSEVDTICDAMRIGETGEVLPSFREIPRSWKVECSVDCSIRRHSFCRRQARISCVSKQETHLNSECGTRRIEVNAKDAKIARYARVVGGFETVPGAFPWTAAIRIKVGKIHHCGASILDHTHLITAAHCFEDDQRPSAYDVVVGDWDNNSTDGTEQVYNVMRIHFYPLYKDIFAHDIAIIELNRPGIRYTDYAVPICLPSREFVYTPGRQCVVSGWGSMGLQYAQRLQAALIPIINRFECVNSSEIYQSMSRSAFCAGYLDGGIDSCQGDSGGPFACRRQDGSFVLAGVISWGDGCAQKKQPGIYTMVAPYLSWINSILNDY